MQAAFKTDVDVNLVTKVVDLLSGELRSSMACLRQSWHLAKRFTGWASDIQRLACLLPAAVMGMAAGVVAASSVDASDPLLP
eukprot:5435227-Amphidinium_carterae.1